MLFAVILDPCRIHFCFFDIFDQIVCNLIVLTSFFIKIADSLYGKRRRSDCGFVCIFQCIIITFPQRIARRRIRRKIQFRFRPADLRNLIQFIRRFDSGHYYQFIRNMSFNYGKTPCDRIPLTVTGRIRRNRNRTACRSKHLIRPVSDGISPLLRRIHDNGSAVRIQIRHRHRRRNLFSGPLLCFHIVRNNIGKLYLDDSKLCMDRSCIVRMSFDRHFYGSDILIAFFPVGQLVIVLRHRNRMLRIVSPVNV